jgi:uncharacterized membrane protein YfcA
MNTFEFTLLVGIGSLIAGFLGALTGLGGGIIIVPMLTLIFGVDIRLAVGASLVSVIATSSGAAAAFVKEGFSNIRVGMFLEIATTIGAICGAYLHPEFSTGLLGIVFGMVLIFSAAISFRPRHDKYTSMPRDRLAEFLRVDSSYPGPEGRVGYHIHHIPQGFGLMYIAGVLSGLLGIGSGAMKVLAMDRVMRIPFKVSTTTSNFMIGVTAVASAGVYLSRGYIHPGLAMPVMLGVSLGALLGARVLVRAPSSKIRLVFSIAIILMAIEMIYNGLTGRM